MMKLMRMAAATAAVLALAIAVSAAPAMAAGANWGPAQVIDTSQTPPLVGPIQLESVSCPTAGFCVAVDLLGRYLTFDGTNWSAPQPIATGFGLPTSVSCASADFCAAVNFSGDASIYNGTAWSTPVQADTSGLPELNSVSCPTASFCAAVDLSGNAITYDGTWSAPQHISIEGNDLESVSCASDDFCAAVDGGVGFQVGNVITYGGAGAGWGSATSLISAMQSISCASATFCGVDDQSGDALTYDPAAAVDDLTNPVASHIDPGSLESVSCPSQSFCATVDNNGLASTYNGSGWSSLTQIDAHGFASVSCPSQNFCAAVDKLGGAVLYELTPANTVVPAITGTAQQGDTLTATTGTWSGGPSSFTYQWQDCTGANCTPIAGATSSSYTLTAGDVGHTIEVTVTAANAGGNGTPASSAPTTVVAAIGPSPTPAPAPPPTPAPAPTPAPHIGLTAAQISAALHILHPPAGQAAVIAAILKHHGVALSFTSPGAGKLAIDWYLTVKHGKKSVETLVARGELTATKPGKTTVTIKLTGKGQQLLKHAKNPLKLTMTSAFAPTGGQPTTVSSTFKLKP